MDSYDEMHQYRLRESAMDRDLPSTYKCRKGGQFQAAVGPSGQVEHQCLKCRHTVEEDQKTYHKMRSIGGVLEVDCPLVVMYRRGKKP
jgi:hypothetical protein